VAGIYRTVTLHKTMFGTYDVTCMILLFLSPTPLDLKLTIVGHGALTLLWGAVEVDIGIATASVPALRPLFHHYFPTMLGTNGSSDYSTDRARPYSSFRAAKKPKNTSIYPLSTIGGADPGSQEPIADAEEGHGRLNLRASIDSNNATMRGKHSQEGGEGVEGVLAKATSGV